MKPIPTLFVVLQGGIYLLHLIDSYCAGISLLVLAFLECLVLQWIYGQHRFSADIYCMLGMRPSLYLKLCWKVITPLLILVSPIVFFSITAGNHWGKSHYPPGNCHANHL